MLENRIIYLDVTKFVAILLVCIGHAYYLTLGTESTVRTIIYMFHMPLFMMISGYFSVHAWCQPFRQFVINKAKQLLLPFLTFFIVLSIYHTIMHHFRIEIRLFLEMAIALLWFLKTLFVCYITVYLFKRIRFISDALRVGVSCFMFMALPNGGVMEMSYMLPMFWTGYLWRKYNGGYESVRLPLTLVATLVFVLFVFIFFNTSPEYHSFSLKVLLENPQYIVVKYLQGVCGSLMVIGGIYYVSRLFSNTCCISWASRLGKYTLGIFVMQYFVIEQVGRVFFRISVIPIDMIPLYDYVFTPLIGIFGMLLSWGCVLLLSRIKMADLLLFGGQYHNK